MNQRSKLVVAGGILRDEDGRIIQCFQLSIGSSSIMYAEIFSIWKGLTICANFNETQVEVESDSKIAIDLITQPGVCGNWKLDILYTKMNLLTQNVNVHFTHFYREGNSAVDWLACDSQNKKITRVFSPAEVPIPVRKIANTDKHGVPYLRDNK